VAHHLRSMRRSGAVCAVLMLGFAASMAVATPAAAAGPVGYVRLAHLSPDTPEVDVYLSKISDPSFSPQVFPGVGYGVMSRYLALPVGAYAVAMRQHGAPQTDPPVLTTQVDVAEGSAYTVAGVGKFAGLGLKVLTDDLSWPAAGKSKVRIIQASVTAPVLDVTLGNGTPVANDVPFATTTGYQLVAPGRWTLQLKPSGSSSVSHVSADLDGGSVYSLLVLDSGGGLRAELRVDARSGSSTPDGSVETGAGGAAHRGADPLVMIAIGLVVLVALVALALRLRWLAGRR
jgi:Domain of unknown function (DUF4397)